MKFYFPGEKTFVQLNVLMNEKRREKGKIHLDKNLECVCIAMNKNSVVPPCIPPFAIITLDLKAKLLLRCLGRNISH